MLGSTLLAAATFGTVAISGAVETDQDSAPVVTAEDVLDGRGGVTYSVSGSVPGQVPSDREKAAAQVSAIATSPVVGTGVQWPVDLSQVQITDGFGPRVAPCGSCSSNHRGLDLAGPSGTRIGSIADGVVVDSVATDNGGLGAHVVVEHRIDDRQVRSVYAHLIVGSPAVKVGDQVKMGQLVGLLGNTGSSTGPHLHLETIVAGTHVDPQKFLAKYADGQPVDIFGAAPTWNPPSDNSDGDEGWREHDSKTYVPPAAPVPEATTPPEPAPAPSSPGAPSVETPSPDPTPSTPPTSVAPSPSAPQPSPSQGTPSPRPSDKPSGPTTPPDGT